MKISTLNVGFCEQKAVANDLRVEQFEQLDIIAICKI